MYLLKKYKMKPTNPNAHTHDNKLQNRDYERKEKSDKVWNVKCKLWNEGCKVCSEKVMALKTKV